VSPPCPSKQPPRGLSPGSTASLTLSLGGFGFPLIEPLFSSLIYRVSLNQPHRIVPSIPRESSEVHQIPPWPVETIWTQKGLGRAEPAPIGPLK
jgi:hypothetical protein